MISVRKEATGAEGGRAGGRGGGEDGAGRLPGQYVGEGSQGLAGGWS